MNILKLTIVFAIGLFLCRNFDRTTHAKTTGFFVIILNSIKYI